MANSATPGPSWPLERSALWWERSDRHYDADGVLWVAGHRARDLALELGTPAFVYSAERISANARRLQQALAQTGRPAQLMYAMKSNRHAPVLRHLRALGLGVDACSPGEVRLALDCGYTQQQISFTAGSLSRKDYAELAAWPDIWINADSLTALRHIADCSPGRTLGLRINPALGTGYGDNPHLRYAGAKPSKFGVYRDRFAEALDLAESLGLKLIGLHCHAGCGYLNAQLDEVDAICARIGEFLDAAPQITRLNLGGGLGIALRESDQELDLDAWSALVRQHFGQRNLELAIEPGSYLVMDAGALLTEVTQVEEKGGRVFVGLNAGFNLHPEPVFYQLPLVPAPAERSTGALQTVTLAGNINEALDLWAEDIDLPPVREGDTLCLLNAGSYGAAMASNHCLRGEFSEHLLAARSAAANATPSQLDSANKRAWDDLYASTSSLVWGEDPLPFLTAYSDDIRAALGKPARVLDAGSGEGRNLPFLLAFDGASVHAIDASSHALAKINPELKAKVHCSRSDLAATPFPDAHFDAITMLDTIETLPDVDPVLAEIVRILKPGGVLLCNIPGFDDGVAGLEMAALSDNSFLYKDSYFFRFIAPEQAEALLQRAGLEIVRSEHCAWREGPHPGFRNEEHQHVSHVLLARRPTGIPGA